MSREPCEPALHPALQSVIRLSPAAPVTRRPCHPPPLSPAAPVTRRRRTKLPAWREAAGDSEYVFWLTAEELEELDQELLSMLLPRARERLTDPTKRPPGSLPVELLLFAYPIAPPAWELGP